MFQGDGDDCWIKQIHELFLDQISKPLSTDIIQKAQIESG